MDDQTVNVEVRVGRLERRSRWSWLPYVVLAIGMGVALYLVAHSATSGELSAEREARLDQDCHSRVDARQVLRDVITQAYTPTNTDPSIQALVEERRTALLARVPPLHCVSADGIPIPVPITEK